MPPGQGGSFGGEDWCRSRNYFDAFHGKSEFELVETPAADPLCNAVETAGGGVDRRHEKASGLNAGRAW